MQTNDVRLYCRQDVKVGGVGIDYICGRCESSDNKDASSHIASCPMSDPSDKYDECFCEDGWLDVCGDPCCDNGIVSCNAHRQSGDETMAHYLGVCGKTCTSPWCENNPNKDDLPF